MHTNYEDIRSRIAEAPRWFDEHAVPRYGAFHPRYMANIYANEGVLMEIACQCGRRFDVALSIVKSSHNSREEWASDEHGNPIRTFEGLIRAGRIHYGDPPNVWCCETGPSTNSTPRRVLQYWRRNTPGDWERDTNFEITLEDG